MVMNGSYDAELDFVNAQERLTEADNRAGERLPVGGDNAKALFSLTFLSSAEYIYSTNRPAKPAMPEPPRAPRPLDQLRQHIRYLHPRSGSYPVAGSPCAGFGGPMTGAIRSLM
jgi:hypothetical protein